MKRSLLAALLTGVLATGALAQNAPAQPPTTPPGTPPPAAAEKKPEAPKTIDELTKDFQKIEGMFTFYRKKEGMTDTLYMEVPESALNKLYLMQATASTGLSGTRAGIFQGAPLDDIPMELRLANDSRILFVRPVVDYRSKDAEMQRTIDRGIPVTILFSADIKARQKERNSYLVDAGAFFKSDIAEFSGSLGVGPGALGIDPSFTYVDSLKVFPENAVIRTMYKLNRSGPASLGGPRAVPFAVSYNFSALPETNYRPRIADARVGYFITNYTDLTNNSSYDKNVNYIQRWNLEKADPSLPLSPPKKPIVWYLDNGIPKKYRAAVKRGLLMYNKAFEKVGIKDAIVVEQMPDDADWDIADVRYNIFRWTDGYPFAIALFRAHPITGEILNAGINFDSAFATGGAIDYDITVDPAKRTARYRLAEYEKAQAAAKEGKLAPWERDSRYCNYLQESQLNFRFGMLALDMLGQSVTGFNKEQFIEQYITEVAAHEFGHCLGLRHNFIASTQFDAKQLADPKVVSAGGIGGTVMEYSPFNIWAIKKPGVNFYAQTVGTYDYFAIQYGYTALNAATPQAELPALRKMASQANLPGNAYRSDGVADWYDPRISRFDLGKDPLEFVTKTMDLSRFLLTNLDKRVPKSGESYFTFTRNFNNLLGTYFNTVFYATRYLGGMYVSENYKGDAKEDMPLVPVSGAQQKRVLSLLNTYIFSESAFNIPKKDLAMLAPNPNLPFEASALNRRRQMFDVLSGFQQTVLSEVFWSYNLRFVADNEFRVANPAEALSLATLFRSVGTEVWSELASGKEISGLRRNLQRAHIDEMIGIVKAPTGLYPRDAVTLAWEQLKKVKGQIATALPKAKGEYGKPHLEESLTRINRVLNATTLVE